MEKIKIYKIYPDGIVTYLKGLILKNNAILWN